MHRVNPLLQHPFAIEIGHRADEGASIARIALGLLRHLGVPRRVEALGMKQRRKADRIGLRIRWPRRQFARVAVFAAVQTSSNWIPREARPRYLLIRLIERRRSLGQPIGHLLAGVSLECDDLGGL